MYVCVYKEMIELEICNIKLRLLWNHLHDFTFLTLSKFWVVYLQDENFHKKKFSWILLSLSICCFNNNNNKHFFNSTMIKSIFRVLSIIILISICLLISPWLVIQKEWSNLDYNSNEVCLILAVFNSYELRHEKTCFCHMQTTKAQISLRIRAV